MGVQISVIVPTHNRSALLERLLQSLFQQTLSPAQFEIIVVSDGSTDGTGDLVRAFRRGHSNLVFIEQEPRGPAAARNAASRAARGKYLAFTDDDCVADKDWLERLSEVFERTDAVAVQGRTTTDEASCTPLTNQVRNETGMYGVPTCNAGYRKNIFDGVGGFDESFPFPHNEDADLAWRVEKLGSVPFAPEVHVMHPPRRETLFQRARWVRYLESDFLLFAKHPDEYRQRCTASPWLTIYRQAFIVAQLGALKASLKYLFPPFKPRFFVQGIGLVLVRGFNLIRFYPFYLRAARRYGRKGRTESAGAPLRGKLGPNEGGTVGASGLARGSTRAGHEQPGPV